MTARSIALTLTVLALGLIAQIEGAETGDFDGDGRLTIRDVRNYMVPVTAETCNVDEPVYPLPEWEFAPGSDDAFRAYPCASAPFGFCSRRLGTWPASVYLEVLRRAVTDGLASYSPMHWIDEWATAPPAPPLGVDEGFSVRLLSVSQDADDEDVVSLEMFLTANRPVRAFSLILEADGGTIRVPWLYPPRNPRGFWDPSKWATAGGIHFDGAEQGDLTVRIPVVGYLITGGRYVVTYGLGSISERRGDPTIEPGEYRVLMPARIPVGTPAGTISLELLETSQVLFQDGVVAAPRVESAGEIVVDREVVDGWDDECRRFSSIRSKNESAARCGFVSPTGTATR